VAVLCAFGSKLADESRARLRVVVGRLRTVLRTLADVSATKRGFCAGAAAPDLRIEYEDIDGRHDHQDVEILTIHYRGARGSAAARSGFGCHGGSSARTGRSADPDLAEELL
jgi:hypothetical protein